MRNVLKISDVTTVTDVREGTFRYVQQVCEEGLGIRYGDMIASYIGAEVFYASNSANDIKVGDTIYYYQTRSVDNSFNSVSPDITDTIGIFYVENVEHYKDYYTFIAYDAIHKLDVDYSQELLAAKSSFPMKVETFLDNVETFMSNLGVSVSVGDLSAYTMSTGTTVKIDYFYADGITVRDILKYFAEISFRFVRCTPDGVIHFPYIEKFDIEAQWQWYSADRYIICPTDQVTYTGIAEMLNGPETVNLIPVFYKQNGLKLGDYSFASPGYLEIRGMSGNVVYSITNDAQSVGQYVVSNNVVAEKIEQDAQWWSDVVDTQYEYLYDDILTQHTITPFEVHLFPFRNPFFAGQLLPHIVDTNGNRYESVIMKLEQTDSEVILTCSGPQNYYDDSTKNSDIASNSVSLSVALNDLSECVDNKVDRSGDTMTGTLAINDYGINIFNTEYAAGDTPASSSSLHINIKGNDSGNIAHFSGDILTDGSTRARITATNGGYTNYLWLRQYSDGTRSVSVSDGAAWREALGLCYAANDTMSVSSSMALHGLLQNSAKTAVYLDVPVEKSMENISTITVTTMSGWIAGVNGALNSSTSATDYTGSSYTLTCVKQGETHVRVYLKSSSAFTNATAFTPVVYFGSLTLTFT